MTGFEPATSRPPDAHSNRTELQDVYKRQLQIVCGDGQVAVVGVGSFEAVDVIALRLKLLAIEPCELLPEIDVCLLYTSLP